MKSILIVVLLCAGCLSTNTVDCGAGVECPVGSVCTTGGGCATPGEVAACDGLVDGEACSVAGGGVGVCQGGACRSGLCGNGVIDPGEVCDDGNTSAGDGCRADCSKVELCGDGLLDQGEGCDDGNANAADGCDACVATAWRARVLIGGSMNAQTVTLRQPTGLAIDGHATLYVADTLDNKVHRVDASGAVTIAAGTGGTGFSGDGGPAPTAQLERPFGVAVDGLGNLYIADSGNNRIRRVAPDGIITTVAGSTVAGTSVGLSGDGGPAIAAQLSYPTDVAVDGLGNLYVADTGNSRIRRIDVAGIITTVAGSTPTGGFSGDGGAATSAQLFRPEAVAVDGLGNLYIADTRNYRIRRVNAAGIITTIAGNGILASSPDGAVAASASLDIDSNTASLEIDALGNVTFGEAARVRQITPGGVLATVAGIGTNGYSGDGGLAVLAELSTAGSFVRAATGDFYLADRGNHRIRKVAVGVITTVAGSGAATFTGFGGAATAAPLAPNGVAVDGSGNLYIASSSRVDRVTPGGVIETVAGTGIGGYGGDNGPATSALLASVTALAVDAAGNLYIADTANNRIRRVDPGGTIVTVAGTGATGFGGDNGPATSAIVNQPSGVAVDGTGNLYIADPGNYRVRRVSPAGTITTVAGTGISGYTGDGGPATNARLNSPRAIAVDAAGNLYIACVIDQRIRRVSLTGVITTVAGTGVAGYSGDGGQATAAKLYYPSAVAVDGTGNLYIGDKSNNRVRRVAVNGVITTIAGTGAFAFAGDGGLATGAQVIGPADLASDGQGRILLTDYTTVRRIANGIITTVAGLLDPAGTGPLAQAHLADPRAFVVGPALTLFAGGSSGTVQAARVTPAWLEVVAGRYPQATATGALARFRDELFGTVSGIAYDAAAGLIFISESSANRLHVVTVVDPADARTWTIAPLANAAGTAGFVDGAAATARFRDPRGLYLDVAARQLYVADSGNHVVRVIDLAGGVASATVGTVAGTPATRGYLGDHGPATQALLYAPEAITRCANGDMFIADTGNQRVRRIARVDGRISTVLGDGVAASSGEGRPAVTFPVHAPLGLSCDASGNVFVTSTTTIRLLPSDAAGVVDGTGDVQTIYGGAPRERFPESVTTCLTDLAVTGSTTVQVLDACTGFLIELSRVPTT